MIEYFSDYRFFDIGLSTMNLFSVMMGMVFAFFQQSLFGQRIGKYIIVYFACLVGWYAGNLYLERNHKTPTESTQTINGVK